MGHDFYFSMTYDRHYSMLASLLSCLEHCLSCMAGHPVFFYAFLDWVVSGNIVISFFYVNEFHSFMSPKSMPSLTK